MSDAYGRQIPLVTSYCLFSIGCILSYALSIVCYQLHRRELNIVSHPLVGRKIQGFSPTLRATPKNQNNASSTLPSLPIATAMPRNKVSDDLDHVRKNPKATKTPKGQPPKQWPLPKYTPLKIKKPYTDNQGQLPNTVTPDNPYQIFDLFFNEATLKILIRHTNEYTFLYPGPEKTRTWFPTTVKKFRAYLGVSI